MYHDEIQHLGCPHFHAYHAGEGASFDIEDLSVVAGGLPRQVRRLVVEWAQEHQAELRENWQRAREHLPLSPVEPLR
jgi:hypothetical protein